MGIMESVKRGRLSLVVAILLTIVSAVSALAMDISGTVTYGGGKTGRVYLGVYQQDGNSTGIGTSIAAPGAYTIRGVQSGSYTVKAFMDTLGYGVPNTVDPLGQSDTVSLTNTNQPGITVPLTDPASPTLAPPQGVMATPGDSSALVMWEPSRDNNDFETATSYNLYWSTDSDVMGTYEALGGSIAGIPARGDGHRFISGFANGTELYFAVTSQIGTSISGAATSAKVTIGTPAGGSTVSGTVSFSGTPPGGPLFIGINPPNGGPVAYSIIAAPVYPQAFTVSGVPSGGYTIFAFIDANSSGNIDLGDPRTARGSEPLILVSGSPVAGVGIQLSGAGASVNTATTHWRDNVSDWYNLEFRAASLTKIPVALVLNSGPNLSIPLPLDMGLDRWGEFQYTTGVPRPNVGDTYNFTVFYSDSSSETLLSQVTGVLDAFATPQTPVGDTYGPSVTTPTFTWSPPDSPPAIYTYGLFVSQQYGWIWDQESLPMTQLSAVYNSDGDAGQPSLSLGTTYGWTISLRDANGNQTQQQVSFTPRSLSTQPGSAGGTYTYNSGNGQLTLNWESSAFPCDGPSIGQETQTVTVLSETTLTWTSGNDSMTWTRISGASGIVGTWSTTDPSSGNIYTLIFGGDGTMSVSATIYQCSNPQPQISGFIPDTGPAGTRITISGTNFDGNPLNNIVTINGTVARVDSASPSQLVVTVMGGTTSGPISVTTQSGTGTSSSNFTVGSAPGNASATYVYTPGSPGTLEINWVSSNFVCDGPEIGLETQSITTLDATTMVWENGPDTMTWTRPPGTPGSILGSWFTIDPPTGNSYTLLFNGDGTMTVSATIGQCSGDFQPPTVPTVVTAQAVSTNQINVNWSASTDNDSVNYYQVYRNGQPAGQPAGQFNTYWPDTFVSPGTTYTYTVAACDFSGNCSAQSAPAQATTPGIPYSMIYGGITHLANSDTYGVPVDAVQIGIGKVGSSLGGMTATVSGPNGFSYTFSDADVRPYMNGQFEVYKEFTSPLETGVYTFTLNDGSGNISNRVDTHIAPTNLPAVDSATIQMLRKSDGSYRFTWAPVNDTKTYFYSLRINRADGTHTPIFNGARKMDGYEDVPATYFTDGTDYEVRVRVGDSPDFSLTFNQANSAYVPFTPQASDYDDSRLMFNYASANNVSGGDPTFGFRMCTAAPSPACGQTQANLVTSFTITGPAGFNGTGSYTNATPSTDLTSPNNVDFSHAFAGAPTGSYTLDVTANGIHHYAYMTLTSAVSYPTPSLSTYKAEYINNNADPTIRFSWADADYTGALYYRVFVKASNNSSSYTSSQRTNQTYVDMAKSQLGDLTFKQWRVEIYDSSSANTQRNRINGPLTTSGSLNSLPTYDSTKPTIGQFRFRNLKHPGGSATDTTIAATDNSAPLGSALVSGPGSYTRNLLLGTGGWTGTGPYSYSYSTVEAGAPAVGLYSLGVTDGSANSVTRYNQQPTLHDVPLVDFRTFKVSLDANGDSRFSWAPVVTDVPLWYSLELVAVNTMQTVSSVTSVQQASVTITAANMQTALMQGSLMFRVWANDGSGWSTSNNVSQSAYAGYSVNYDYSTLTDSDGDSFASDIDSNDIDPTINPYSAAGGSYSITGRVTDQAAAPLSGIMVIVLSGSSLDYVNSTTTDSSGYYAVSGLPAGTYKVQFIDPSLSHDAVWYSGKYDGVAADSITFYGPALTTFTANAALTSDQTGGISGRVTDGVNGIAGIRVGAFRASNLAYAAGAFTDADGYFVIGGLTTDSYKIIFVGSDGGYQDLWYNGAATPDGAAPVSVTAPNYTINVTGTLSRSTTTTVVLASGGNPSYAGDPLTFTATVSPAPSSGTIQFKVDGVNVGTPVALVGGSATSAAITSILPGIHSVTAEYSGGTGYAASISSGITQTANPKAMIGTNGNFLTLQSAVNTSLNSEILLLRDTRFAEDLLINATASRPASFTITIKGGLGSDFVTPAATFTSIRKLTIKDGKVIVNRLAVKPD